MYRCRCIQARYEAFLDKGYVAIAIYIAGC